MAKTVLIVDDEATQLEMLSAVVTRLGYDVQTASGGEAAIAAINGKKAPDLVLLDLVMPEIGGLEVLHAVRPDHGDLPIIVLTAHSGISRVVECMRAGANDFLVKPASAEKLRLALEGAEGSTGMVGELEPVAEALEDHIQFRNLIGAAPSVIQAVEIARRAAKTSVPILIEGESGVGKEVFARAIQQASERSGKPFVTVNCGAIPDNLVESILFGHEKGAFTGANDKHVGKFKEAHGGTLFLDEIGELPLDIQPKLLRAIQEGEIDPVGARAPIKIDIRFVSATNRDLAELVATGAFREDLYYRLNVFPMTIPPLRERREDIPALVTHFVERFAKSEGLKAKQVSRTALERLINYDWPGNIRQLQNAVFRSLILCDGASLTSDAFEGILPPARMPELSLGPRSSSRPDSATQAPHSTGSIDPEADMLPLCDAAGNVRTLAEIEADAIRFALAHYGGRMARVARELGIGRSTLYRKVAELGLDSEADAGPEPTEPENRLPLA